MKTIKDFVLRGSALKGSVLENTEATRALRILVELGKVSSSDVEHALNLARESLRTEARTPDAPPTSVDSLSVPEFA